MNYFNHLKSAIDSHSLSQFIAAVEQVRQHRKAVLIAEGELFKGSRPGFVGMSLHGVLESRGDKDLTPLMYTCLRYYDCYRRGDTRACEGLNAIAGWLVEQRATVLAEGGRPLVLTKQQHNGRPMFVRGMGKTIVEVLGQNNLPPSVLHHIRTVVSDYPEQAARKPIAWKNPIIEGGSAPALVA